MVKKYGLYFAWLLALIGTLGALYFSEIRLMEPCPLCWFQRICLFPMAIILGIATYRSDYAICRYALPLALIGLLFASYQVAIQEVPGWNPIELCGNNANCSEKSDIGLGPISLPMLSVANFTVISLLLIAVWVKNGRALRSSK